MCARRVRWLRGVTRVRELFDIVHQTKQFPLSIDFGAPAQCEVIESLVVPQIRKHRLDRGEASAILFSSTRRIDARFHAHRVCVARVERVGRDATTEERDVADVGGVGRPQALRA